MRLNSERTRKLLQRFDFKTLFVEELGWDHYISTLNVPVDGRNFALSAIAEKRGMVVFICEPLNDGSIPEYSRRRKIERQVAKSAHEHIIIYPDAGKSMQIWQWVKREAGKPTACREHPYYRTQPGDSLIQKINLLSFSIEEEENLTIVDVGRRARKAFDVDRVTKRFYDRFKAEHEKFLKFLKGIPDEKLQRWYVSVMLNRLMFIYFIQKKGFLDKDTNYLRSRLGKSKQYGKDLYYKNFLCPLFFEGFAKKEAERSPETNQLLGTVPYLDGGLFQRHQIENRHGKEIQIEDAAFENLFAFFERYQWHLDERPVRADNEINPDVLGYIFEKYINQKQMGAYYTKEDITEYISKNTIIPFLLDKAEKKCRIAFEGEQSVWRLLTENPDRYIYDAVKKGAELPLPDEIAAGIKDVSKRAGWNKPAPSEYALPTEIWREVVARRRRYEEIWNKMVDGEVRSVNDLITYNLDIRQFAHDVIENCEGPELLRAIYYTIAGRIPEKSNQQVQPGMSILDPTCGSGAFLFAALNILEPLYEACLDRMQVFLDELESSEQKHRSDKFGDFRKILERIEKHPNRRYFILKSIILNNLYGVDIMEEAVEICKLRLFLKLVAQVDNVEKIEPLPDIDFNIRAGNTLVGFASYDEVKNAVEGEEQGKFDFDDAMVRIDERAQDVDDLFNLFREMQTEHGMDTTDFPAGVKQKLGKNLEALGDELDRYLASEYGIDKKSIPNEKKYEKRFMQWRESHQPFHWFIEFYGIIKDGGFDVIIGNPPYVAYRKIIKEYRLPPNYYITESCGNLYSFIMERCYSLLFNMGRFGMIVPVSFISGESYEPLARISFCNNSWVSSFSNRPGKLFYGVEQRLVVFLRSYEKLTTIYTTNYLHWYEHERAALFYRVAYYVTKLHSRRKMPYKIGNPLESSILDKLCGMNKSIALFEASGEYGCWYHDGPTYWIRTLPFRPKIAKESSNRSNHYHRLSAKSPGNAFVICSILNSSSFYFFFKTVSNCRDFGNKELYQFPIGQLSTELRDKLEHLGRQLGENLKTTAKLCTRVYPSGQVEYEEYYPAKFKPIIDQIDRVLAKHYGFTDEELDFIINYDIKYRMGVK